eukprot:386416-Prymnesium_polylepis.1
MCAHVRGSRSVRRTLGVARDRWRARGHRAHAPGRLQLRLLGSLRHCASSVAAAASSPPACSAGARRVAAAAPAQRSRRQRDAGEAAASGGGRPPASRGRTPGGASSV